MVRRLKIAQIGSIWETTPPKLYGGTERVVSVLTEELIKMGHDVTLFATGDSKTSAKLDFVIKEPLYRQKISWSNIPFPLMHIYNVYKKQKQFDILHAHLNLPSDFMTLAFSDLMGIPTVFTLHFRLPTQDADFDHDIYLLLKQFSKSNYISISDSQRRITDLNYVATVYNGIDLDKYSFSQKGGEPIGWLGRFKPDKGPQEAIEVSIQSGHSLVMAGKLDTQDKADQKFYKETIEPKLDAYKGQIKFIGEVDDSKKNVFLGGLKCFVNPINWEEPFGLVVAEANACGTPVVAFARGSMPEIIKDGVNGFLVEPGDTQGLIKIVNKIYLMDDKDYLKLRKTSRSFAEQNFSGKKMAEGYEKVYQKIGRRVEIS